MPERSQYDFDYLTPDGEKVLVQPRFRPWDGNWFILCSLFITLKEGGETYRPRMKIAKHVTGVQNLDQLELIKSFQDFTKDLILLNNWRIEDDIESDADWINENITPWEKMTELGFKRVRD